jgi:hypothetical protein
MKRLIKIKYYFKEYPNSSLSRYFETYEQSEDFKSKHPNYVYIEEVN